MLKWFPHKALNSIKSSLNYGLFPYFCMVSCGFEPISVNIFMVAGSWKAAIRRGLYMIFYMKSGVIH